MKKRKRTPEERDAERARQDDLTRRMLAAIERLRARSDKDTPIGDANDRAEAAAARVRKPWTELSSEERAAERARSRDLDRRLLAAIARYRALNAETPEAEAS
jgi:hypothetical protein